jgi:hypothetical protein
LHRKLINLKCVQCTVKPVLTTTSKQWPPLITTSTNDTQQKTSVLLFGARCFKWPFLGLSFIIYSISNLQECSFLNVSFNWVSKISLQKLTFRILQTS